VTIVRSARECILAKIGDTIKCNDDVGGESVDDADNWARLSACGPFPLIPSSSPVSLQDLSHRPPVPLRWRIRRSGTLRFLSLSIFSLSHTHFLCVFFDCVCVSLSRLSLYFFPSLSLPFPCLFVFLMPLSSYVSASFQSLPRLYFSLSLTPFRSLSRSLCVSALSLSLSFSLSLHL